MVVKQFLIGVLIGAVMLAGWADRLCADLGVSTDYEGGSAIVDAVDSLHGVVEIRPAGDPARGWPCWWYLRIDGLTVGQDATVVVRGSNRPGRNDGKDTGEPLASSWTWTA